MSSFVSISFFHMLDVSSCMPGGGQRAWVPSQKCGRWVRWQPQIPSCFASFTSNGTGSFPVSSCDPSHKGSAALFPQLHQWYVPGSSLIRYGRFLGMCRPSLS
jgi:hypothetical protein